MPAKPPIVRTGVVPDGLVGIRIAPLARAPVDALTGVGAAAGVTPVTTVSKSHPASVVGTAGLVVGVGVADTCVALAVLVAVPLMVPEGVAVEDAVWLFVPVLLAVLVAVPVEEGVPVRDAVLVPLAVAGGVAVLVPVELAVAVWLAVLLAVAVALEVCVLVPVALVLAVALTDAVLLPVDVGVALFVAVLLALAVLLAV